MTDDKLKPCPFCGEPLSNRPAGPFNILGMAIVEEGPMHYNPNCILNGLGTSETWIMLNRRKWNQRATDTQVSKHSELTDQSEYAPCPTCKQCSHSIGEDQLAAAYRHFYTMEAHPVRGHPMGYLFDEQTREAVDALLTHFRQAPDAQVISLVSALELAVHENGPVAVDWMGEQLAWRPLDHGTWSALDGVGSESNLT